MIVIEPAPSHKIGHRLRSTGLATRTARITAGHTCCLRVSGRSPHTGHGREESTPRWKAGARFRRDLRRGGRNTAPSLKTWGLDETQQLLN